MSEAPAPRPRQGPFALLRSSGIGGSLARRLLPLVIILPPALAALHSAAVGLGLFSALVGMVWFTVAQAAIFAGVVLVTAASLERLDDTRRNAETEAGSRELRYRLLFDSHPQPMWVYDPVTLAFLAVNDAAVEHYGYTREEFLRMTLADIRPAEEVPRLRQSIREIGAEPLRSGCWKHLKRDGTAIDVEVCSCNLDFDGRPARLVTVRDRTAELLAERALAASETQFRAIFELSAVGQAQAEPFTGRILRTNAALCRLVGYAPDELIGMTFSELTHPEDRERDWDIFARMVRGEMPSCSIEKRYVHKNGDARWVRVEAVVIRDASGQPLHTTAVIQDIAARKEAEQALRESQSLFSGFMDNNPALAYIRDAGGRLRYVNRAYEAFHEAALTQLAGKSLREMASENLAAELAALYARVLAEQRALQAEMIVPDPQGQPHHFVFSVFPIVMDGGEQYVGGMALNITDRKQAEDALRETNRRLEEALVSLEQKSEQLQTMSQQLWQTAKLATMGELAASIAHELNNPLGTVTLRVEGLLEDLDAGAPYRRDLEVIEQEVDRMAGLVAHLLQFSRRTQPQISTIDVREELDHTLELVHFHLRNRGIAVVREFPGVPTRVQADRQQLRQLFLNLFTNASDAMPQGGTLTLRVTTNGEVVINVGDTGMGIPPELLEKVKEPFFTTKPEGKGTGLGLAICQRIVQEHRGTFTLTSREGEGTLVQIVFPRNGSHGAHGDR